MKRLILIFGIFTLVASMAAGVYYVLFLRSRKPQVELYFDDGSMLAMRQCPRGRAFRRSGRGDPGLQPRRKLGETTAR